MLTRYHHAEIPVAVAKLAAAFRLYGWVGFWLQLVTVFLAVIVLLLTISGRAFSPDASPVTGFSIFWAVCGIALLVVGILFDVRYVRMAKGLLHEPGGLLHPRKAGAIRLLRLGALISFAGIVLALFGAGSSVWVLVAKTVSQPPGVAILDPNKIVRAMDVFVVLANITLIGAHLVGTMIAFRLLDQVYHYHYAHPHIMQATRSVES